MSLIYTIASPNDCQKCSGFGIFILERPGGKYKLIECPACGSIHPEIFDLSYISSKPDNIRFYVFRIKYIFRFLKTCYRRWRRMIENKLLIGVGIGLFIAVVAAFVVVYVFAGSGPR